MNRARRIAAGARVLLFLALVQPIASSAQDADCALLRTIVARDPAALRSLRLGYQPGTGITFWLGRNRAALAPASECELDAGREHPAFECRWAFRDYRAAAAFYVPLLEQARRCLRVPFTPGVTQNEPSAWMIMRRSEAEIGQAVADDDFDENAVGVEIELIESTHPGSVTYYVRLSVDR